MKKIISLVLTLIMALSFVSFADAEDVVEIEFFSNRSFGSAASELENDNFVEQYIREKLGVDIKYVYTDDIDTTLNLRLMSDDTPDIFLVSNRNRLREYVSEEYVLNLDEHADALTDVFAFTEGNLAAGKIDGITYAIPGRPYGFREAYWYNGNAFAAVGITEVPATLDGLMDAVRAVMAADIDGNGVNDTVGLTGSGWETLCEIFGAFGVTTPNILSLDENGKVESTMLSENYYNAMVYANGLWEEGIIDHEIFNLNSNQVVDKCMTESTVLAELQWPNIKKAAAWESFLTVDPDACWEIVGPVTGPDGVTNYVGDYGAAAFTSLVCINADLEGEKLEAALKLVNFMGTDEGLMLTTYGVEGVHWDYNAEGIPTVRAEEMQNIDFSWIYQLAGREELSYCRVKFGEEAYKYIEQSHLQPSITNVTVLLGKPAWYNYADAQTFISEECAKFLTGERELNETEWANFLETLDSTYQYKRMVEENAAVWEAMVG